MLVQKKKNQKKTCFTSIMFILLLLLSLLFRAWVSLIYVSNLNAKGMMVYVLFDCLSLSDTVNTEGHWQEFCPVMVAGDGSLV